MKGAQLRHREGLEHMAKREFAEAAARFAEAARLEPGQPAAWLALGLARREMGLAEEALEALGRARKLDPAMGQVNGQMGLILLSMGRLPEAIDHLGEEAARFPQAARNHNNLGMALAAAGQDAQAEESFLRAVRIDRDYVHAHSNLAASFQRRGDLAAAEAALRQVIRLAPGEASAHARLGHILTTTWRLQEAETVLAKAMELDPDDLAPSKTLAWVLARLNRPGDAKALARAVLERHPEDLQASVVEALSIPAVYESGAALAAAREAYALGLEGLITRAPRFAADPSQVLSLAWENFHIAYQGGDDRVLQTRYAEFIAGLGSRAVPRFYEPRPPRARAAGERIRVGFLSSFFRDCTAGKYFRSWPADLDRSRFEVFVYYTGHVKDDFSSALGEAVEHYRRIIDAVPRVAEVVLADELDVLIFPDVGMDTAGYLLAGMRLAPIQCAGWGHPVTTGQAAIDYFLTCAHMEPDDAQDHYSEKLVPLPGIGTRYSRPGPASAMSRAALGLPESGPLFLCPQSLFKIHPDNDGLFASVLDSAPGSTLVFFRDHDEPLTGHYRERLTGELERRGVDAQSRTLFLPRLGHADYLRVNELCDAMLDTLHWSGGNTSLDAFAAGLPLVTLPGRFMRGRQSLAMLRQAGVPELVAKDEADYVRIAARLARDRPWREEVAGRVIPGAARLFDDPAPLAALAEFLAGVGAKPRA